MLLYHGKIQLVTRLRYVPSAIEVFVSFAENDIFEYPVCCYVSTEWLNRGYKMPPICFLGVQYIALALQHVDEAFIGKMLF